MRNLHLLACLILSGFAGLAYELLWVRLLALGLGSTTLSFSAVLAVFFLGLAAGAALAGRYVQKLRRPVRVYALLEVATAGLAFVLYPALSHIGELFALLDPGSGLGGGLARAAVAAPLLLGPTLLMGATLPVVVRAMLVRDEAVGSGSALIYGFNTLGAFLGTYAISYLILPEIGVWASTVVAAFINLAAAALAWWREDPRPLPTAPVPPVADGSDSEPDDSIDERKIRQIVTALAFFIGFAGICFQVVWVRLFSIFLQGTVYGVGSVLIAVLLGIGLGSLFVAPLLRLRRAPGLWFVGLQVLILVAVAALSSSLPIVAYILQSLQENHRGLMGLHLQLAMVVVVLLPTTLASGASFPLLVAIIEKKAARAGRSLGSLYATHTVGSISGSILTGFLFLPQAGTAATLSVGLASVGLTAALGAALLLRGSLVGRLGLVAAALGLVGLWSGFDVQRVSLSGRALAQGRSYKAFSQALDSLAKRVVFFSEGRAATVVVSKSGDTRSLSLNGLGQGGRRGAPPHHIYESLMVALVPMVHAEAPNRALVVGLGAGVTVDALIKLGAKRVDVVELEADVVEGLEHIFPSELSPLKNPNVRLRMGDARHVLLVGSRRKQARYDLITSMPAHPWVASPIFTREFFELARDNLSDRGVFATWFGLGRMDQDALDSLVRAFVSSFDNYIIYHVRAAGALYLVGGVDPLFVDVDRFRELRSNPIVDAQPSITSDYHLAAQVVATGRVGDPLPEPGVVNTDDSAFVELRAPRTSSSATDISDLVPHPYLRADMLEPADSRSEHALALMEILLGTPGGQRNPAPRFVPVEHLARTLNALKGTLVPSTRRYLQGRLELARGRPEKARTLLAEVDGGLDTRARSFLPLAEPEGPARRTALQNAPKGGHVWLTRLSSDPDALREDLPTSPPGFENDRWGWLIWHGLSETATLTQRARARFAELGPTLMKTSNVELLALAYDLAERNRLTTEAAALHQRQSQARRQKVRRVLKRARNAGLKQDFRRAAEALEDGLALDPANPRLLELLLVCVVELNDLPRLERLRDEMRFVGFGPHRIRHLIKDARAGKLAARALSSEGSEQDSDGPAPNGPESSQRPKAPPPRP